MILLCTNLDRFIIDQTSNRQYCATAVEKTEEHDKEMMEIKSVTVANTVK